MQIEGANGGRLKINPLGRSLNKGWRPEELGLKYTAYGEVTLTDAVRTPIGYFFNDGSKSYLVEAKTIRFGTSTGGTTDGLVDFEANNENDYASGSPADMTIINQLRGKADVIEASLKVATTGATLTAGKKFGSRKLAEEGDIVDNTSDIIVTPGTGFAVFVTAPASNTSMLVALALDIEEIVED